MRARTRYSAYPAVLLTILLAACGGDAPIEPIDSLPRPLTNEEQLVITSSNSFGLDLFQRVYAVEASDNVFLSPISASMALGMTMNGAVGETWNGMRQGLHFGSLSQDEINVSYQGLMDLLLDLDPRVDVGIGNSIWIRDDFTVVPTFKDLVAQYFDATAREMDFADPATLDVINGWISDVTRGLIQKGLDQITEADMVFLINAIYFNGKWVSRFDEDDTQQRDFARRDGSSVQVPMMAQETDFPYRETDAYQAVEMGYGGDAFSMVVVLPKPELSLDDVVASLDDDGWAALVAGMDSMEVELHMPKFTTRYDTYLNDPLVAMGMDSAFSRDADFNGLTPDPLACIQYVRQKSFVEVDEAGTRAAAVTVVGIGVTSAPPPPPVMNVDHPFLFAIRERLSGTILFIGAIGDPTLEQAPQVEKPAPPC